MQRRISLVLAAISFLIIGTACNVATQSRGSVESTPQPVEKHLSSFSPIEGTNFLIANISGNPAEERSASSPFNWIERGYSGYSGYGIYNYVFFSKDTETFNKLLPTNDYVVLQIIGLPTDTLTEKPEDFEPVQWWLYILAKADTDQNGILDNQDQLTIGVTDVGGNSPTEVILDADSLLGHTLKDQNVLFVIYHAQDKNYVAKIDLPGRQIISTTEMDLGGDVK